MTGEKGLTLQGIFVLGKLVSSQKLKVPRHVMWIEKGFVTPEPQDPKELVDVVGLWVGK